MRAMVSNTKVILLTMVLVIISARIAVAGATDPPNFQPNLAIEYLHPNTHKKVAIRNCLPGKAYQVPAGVSLSLIFEVHNTGDNPSGDGVSIDIWYDWPYGRPPNDYVDPDEVCLPESPSDCQRMIKTLKADLSYAGKEGKGVYNIVVWVDRFDTQTEVFEDDNYLGPIKIVVLPTVHTRKEPLVIQTPNIKTIKRPFQKK
jgi:hypothetical protein